MSRLEEFFGSSIGRKSMVALAGLLLCGFLLTHLAGNLFLLQGEGPFNHYAEALTNNPLILPAELALLALFLAHIAVALRLRWVNMQARPVRYEAAVSKGGRTPGSRSMAVSGIVVLAFLVIHLKGFRFGDDQDGLFRLVVDSFANPWITGFYVVSMAALSLHLSHGFQSAFQTLGLNHPKYMPWVKRTGWVFAFVICGGFAILPVFAYFKGVQP